MYKLLTPMFNEARSLDTNAAHVQASSDSFNSLTYESRRKGMCICGSSINSEAGQQMKSSVYEDQHQRSDGDHESVESQSRNSALIILRSEANSSDGLIACPD